MLIRPSGVSLLPCAGARQTIPVCHVVACPARRFQSATLPARERDGVPRVVCGVGSISTSSPLCVSAAVQLDHTPTFLPVRIYTHVYTKEIGHSSSSSIVHIAGVHQQNKGQQHRQDSISRDRHCSLLHETLARDIKSIHHAVTAHRAPPSFSRLTHGVVRACVASCVSLFPSSFTKHIPSATRQE